MYRNSKNPQMSDMEREFELEMDNDRELESGDDFEFEMTATDEESEYTDYEADDFEMEQDDYEAESYDEPQNEYEWFESNDYGERFYELSQREFESESEADEAVNEILNEMEHEFFLGGLLKGGGLLDKAKNAAKKLAKKGMDLAKKAGINIPSLDALKSMLGPVSGLLKGNLAALIKPALKTALAAHPAGAALLPVLQGIGFEASEDTDGNREMWNRYASVAREAFENLAQTINENADHPLEASRLATNAFQKAVKNHQNRGVFVNQAGRRFVGIGRKKRVRRVYAAPDEVIVVIQRKR